ncbi:MAG: hypothetical protein NWQ21_05475, partial [Desulfobacterales bacterium]|nr:hypothetical protein [Desulfobacterales bacterium]
MKSRETTYADMSFGIKYLAFYLILLFFGISCTHLQPFHADDNIPPSASQNDDALAGIVNPFNSTCYDWRENIIPCDFKGPYVELMSDTSISDSRFTDHKDGT